MSSGYLACVLLMGAASVATKSVRQPEVILWRYYTRILIMQTASIAWYICFSL